MKGPNSNTQVFGTVTYNAASKTATFAPNQALAPNGTYVVELTQAIQDTTGESLNQGIESGSVRETWQFETTGPPVQFDNTGYTVNEGDVATVMVTLQSPSAKPVMVGYRTVAIPGEAVPGTDYTHVSATLTFPAGWALISYLRTAPMPIAQALDSVAGKFTLAKDNEGQVYWPDLGVNQIGEMQPGQGYQMHMATPGTLLYPDN